MLIINFTPTGMVPTRKMTPHVPIAPNEIVSEVLQAARMGASIAHLHARDPDGTPTWRKDVYREIIQGIRRANPELVLCVSTSGRNFPEFEKRADVLELEDPWKPDMASLTLGSLNFSNTASTNSPQMIQALLARMNERGIRPELEVFDLGMLNYAKYLIKKKLLLPPYYFNILLGNISTAQAELPVIAEMIRQLPPSCVWALAGIGDCQPFVTSLAVLLGGNVRIGLEDNIYYDPQRTRLATNRMLLKRLIAFAETVGVPIAGPAQVRELLTLPSRTALPLTVQPTTITPVSGCLPSATPPAA